MESPALCKGGRGDLSFRSFPKEGGASDFSAKNGGVGKTDGVVLTKRGEVPLIFILTNLFHFYLSLSVWCVFFSVCVCVCVRACVCVCVVYVCVFCLFMSFVSVLFLFHRNNLVLYHLINRYIILNWINFEKERKFAKQVFDISDLISVYWPQSVL